MNIESLRPYKSELTSKLESIGIVYVGSPSIETVVSDFAEFYLNEKTDEKDNFLGGLISGAVSLVGGWIKNRKNKKDASKQDKDRAAYEKAEAERQRKLESAKRDYMITETKYNDTVKQNKEKKMIFFASFIFPVIIIYFIFLK